MAAGGKILLSGESGLTQDSAFFTDFGVTYRGRSEIDASYLVPTYDMKPNGIAPYLMYERGHLIEAAADVQVMAHMQDSYFNRSFRRFCSHRNTPNDPNSLMPGAVIAGGIGYIAWNVFSEYGEHGAYHHKQIVCDMLDALLGDEKTLTMAQGVGKKMAQRIILELKDKLTGELPESASGSAAVIPAAAGNKASEASAALASLGYSQSEIGRALKGIDVDHLSLEEIVRMALRAMVMQ